MIQRLLKVGEKNFLIHKVPVRVQLALGSTRWEGHKQTTELLREARMAVLASIRQHKDHMHFSPTFDKHSLEAFKLIGRVQDGLSSGEFELYYQPKINLSDGQVCGSEGLIRWRDKQGKLIPPNLFMPKVESTSLIGPMTHFVIQSAGGFLLKNERQHPVSINLSVHNLYDDKVHQLLRGLVEESRLPPEQLEVELTESAFINDLKSAHAAIQRIRDLGIKVSIDDFGTGFASFEYIQHLPITGLKIDRTFVANLADTEKAKKLMACMIDLGHALDLVVTAEGVETQQQETILRQLGCDYAQGFYYSPAMPEKEYRQWVRGNTNPPNNQTDLLPRNRSIGNVRFPLRFP